MKVRFDVWRAARALAAGDYFYNCLCHPVRVMRTSGKWSAL